MKSRRNKGTQKQAKRCRTQLPDGTFVRRLSERELEEFRAGVERAMPVEG